MFTLERWPGITDSEWDTYHSQNDQKRLEFLMRYILPKSRIFEIGCGCGFQAGVIAKNIQSEPSSKNSRQEVAYSGFDDDPMKVLSCRNMAVKNKINAEFFKYNIMDLDEDYLDGFDPDVILFTEVLEHIEKYEEAFAKISKIVKNKRTMLMTIPLKDRLTHVPGHINNFSDEDIKNLCRKNKLNFNESATIADTFSFFLIRRIEQFYTIGGCSGGCMIPGGCTQ